VSDDAATATAPPEAAATEEDDDATDDEWNDSVAFALLPLFSILPFLLRPPVDAVVS
jgi:hypothetical protein